MVATSRAYSAFSDASAAMRALKIGAIWKAFVASPMSFKLVCLYVFFEYVRPQSIYTFLQGPPWSLLSMIAAGLAYLVEGRSPRLPPLVLGSLFAFACSLLLSSALATYPSYSFSDLDIFFGWIFVIVLISGTVTTERRWFIFQLLMLLFCFKMSQHGMLSWIRRGFSFASWGVAGAPGWFQNSGEFALQMGIFVPLASYSLFASWSQLSWMKRGLYLLLPISGLAVIVASSSRGGLLAIICVGFYAAMRSRYRIRALVGLAVAVPALWLTVPEESKARFSTAGSDATSVQRLTYWKKGLEMANAHPISGIGHNNWMPYYQQYHWVPGDSLNRYDGNGNVMIYAAHNSFIQVLSELGYTGLLSFLAVIFSVIHTNRQTRKMLLPLGNAGRMLSLSSRALDDGTIAFCVAGFFMSVAYYPFIWFQLAMSVGVHRAAVAMRRQTVSETKDLSAAAAARRSRSRFPAREAKPISTIGTHIPVRTETAT